MPSLSDLRQSIRDLHLADERTALINLVAQSGPDAALRRAASERATKLVENIRTSARPGLMEVFLAEYGLSTDEGIALMCLAEALLRVPDADTIDELIEDKIAPSSWGTHLGHSSSSLVNASTWALMLTGRVLQDAESDSVADTLRRAVRRLGEPVIRVAVKRAMQEMGQQFVLGQTIGDAMSRARATEAKGYTYSYDMLGEAALTAADASDFFDAYANAIRALAKRATGDDPRANPGISIKLSALHPRYETRQKARVMSELVPRLAELVHMARDAGIGLNIDAEEADRLDLSLDVIEAVLRDDALVGWDGFGVVVQAYGKRAPAVIDWLHALAEGLDRKIMVRLVKGAYWDTEIKRAQVDGLPGFPVYTEKNATDISYICCARKLLDYADRIYPQFATHNAHSAAAILEMADGEAFEFQRLHGMGAALHDDLIKRHGARCRIYAPVGPHRDLLAYLVRRLLENGANSSFVNQIVDEDIPAAHVARDPFETLDQTFVAKVLPPADLFGPDRRNSRGWNLQDPVDLEAFTAARAPFMSATWDAAPLIAGADSDGAPIAVTNPADPTDKVGAAHLATARDIETALSMARVWTATPAERQAALARAADLFEAHAGELFALLCREAGKTADDAVAELREAVDFLRFYGTEAVRLGNGQARGVIACISPWNFPLAIYTGQIAAALAAGNGVIAKPADPTPLIAIRAARLLHEAGVPADVLQVLPGTGAEVGAAITTDPRIGGICFTGSTRVAQIINRAAAETLAPDAMFIAETGGLNAMIVDSTALPEQAIRDVVDSAFRSCGQRCSALRVLYLQEDIAKPFLDMLYGAMDELRLGAPGDMATDIGPVITEAARAGLAAHVEAARAQGRLLKQLDAPETGLFFGPAVLSVHGISALAQEVFGPILHVATFKADEIDRVVADINASGFGLTFGLHTRIDDRVERVTQALDVGNIYVNRNQIGAVVGSQPFGGEGLSGTGPKAGGPCYVARFQAPDMRQNPAGSGVPVARAKVQAALEAARLGAGTALESRAMPGPTGESNLWSMVPRGKVLCLGPTADDARQQAEQARQAGCGAVMVAPAVSEGVDGRLDLADLAHLTGFSAVILWSDPTDQRRARAALAKRDGPMIPLITAADATPYCVAERHLCIDTTAAGGNASLLAAQ